MKVRFLLLVLLLLIFKGLNAQRIHLTGIDAYLKIGFDGCPITPEEISEKNWYKIRGKKDFRSISIPKLNLKELPKRKFIELRTLPKRDFTLVFIIPEQNEMHKLKSPGIYFERIGESWEIFWNHHLIDSNLSETISFTIRGYVISIPLIYVKKDINILCIHLKGDPLSTRTGFYYGKNYYIDELKNIYKDQIFNYLLIIFLVTLYISFGGFNMIFFLKQKENRYHLFFSLFCIVISLYIFVRSSMVQYIPYLRSADFSSLLEFLSLYSLIPIFSMFFYDIFKSKLNKIIKLFLDIGIVHGFLFCLVIIFLPSNAYGGILKLWQLSAPIFMVLFSLLIIYLSYKEFIALKKEFNLIQSLYKMFIFTVPGNFLIGVIFVTIFVGIDIYININKISAPNISNYGFLFFLSGISFRLSYHLIEILNRIKISERKYRHLYDNSSDILFILNQKLEIREVNDSFSRYLFWQKKDVIGKKIENLIYKQEKERNPVLKNFMDWLQKEFKEKKRIQIQLPLIARSDIPFQYFEVSFEKIQFEFMEIPEILMKCTPLKKNPITSFLVKEYQKYVLTTDLSHVEKILSKITETLTDIMDSHQLSLIRIALREMLINAIEHGNLGISGEEKNRYLMQGIYDQVLKEKLKNPMYMNKKIIVEYKLTSKEVAFKITDEGKGFDVNSFMKKMKVNTNALHGRGIFITKNAFNKIYYNQKGNSVILVRYF